jgi:hypothetical protein
MKDAHELYNRKNYKQLAGKLEMMATLAKNL